MKIDLPVTWVAVDEVMGRFHPDNPNKHDEERDVQATLKSLLEVGWVECLTLQHDGFLIGGEGRTLAADVLRGRSQSWFDRAYAEWSRRHDDTGGVAKLRFKPSYWEQVPCIIVDLDEESQKALLLRLNDRKSAGELDNQAVAEILNSLSEPSVELAGMSPEEAAAFAAAFLSEPAQEMVEDDVELEGWNSVIPAGRDDPQTIDVTVKEVEDDFSLPDVDPEHHPNVNYDSKHADTKAILFLSYDELDEYKALVQDVAELFGLDMEQPVKHWRSEAVLEALRWVSANYEDAGDEDTEGSPGMEVHQGAEETKGT